MKSFEEGAEALARLTAAVCRRLGFHRPPVQLMGGVFLNQPLYVRMFSESAGAGVAGLPSCGLPEPSQPWSGSSRRRRLENPASRGANHPLKIALHQAATEQAQSPIAAILTA